MLALFHAPRSRSSRILWVLEELGADYELKRVNIVRQDGSGGADPANPHPDKKVPTLKHDAHVITESMAIVLYLCDLYPDAEISRPIGNPERGELLTWLFYYSGVIEPVVHFQFIGVDSDPRLQRTFRGRAEMDSRILGALTKHPYLLGERFSAADIVLASVGAFMRNTLPAGDLIDDYLVRCNSRPARLRADAKDNGAI
ncbi:MAG: glutathione S-transferase [Alphaproteobacteria bacterium]